jgi:hypothetical protein
MATATPSTTPGSGGTPAAKAPEAPPPGTTGSGTPAPKAPPLGRAVVWAGLAAGTAVTVLAVMNGIRIPGLQVVLSVLATWVLLMVLAVTVAEMLRRHHRALARHAWRHSKRGALFTRCHAHRGARSLWGYLAREAAARWENRQHRPLMFTRPPASGAEPPPPYVTDGPCLRAPMIRPPPLPAAGQPLKGHPP